MYNEKTMPSQTESFHPTLVEQGYVTDEHREYAEWARATYRSLDDVPGMHGDLLTAETAAGDLIRYYVNEPNQQLPDNRRDGLLVRRHPFANGTKNHPHMRLWSQIIADTTGMRVVSLPNNIGNERAEHFSAQTKSKFKKLGFRAVALAHAEVAEGEMLGSEPVYPFGWSEGGSAAAALYAVTGDRFEVRGTGVGDPPNSKKRSTVKLLRDFTTITGESFEEAAERTSIPALAEALHLGDKVAQKAGGSRWIRGILSHPPFARVAMMKQETVFNDIEAGLEVHKNSEALLFTGELSPVAPLEVIQARTADIQARLHAVGRSGLNLLVLEGSGHGAADQVFDQAVIASRVAAA